MGQPAPVGRDLRDGLVQHRQLPPGHLRRGPRPRLHHAPGRAQHHGPRGGQGDHLPLLRDQRVQRPGAVRRQSRRGARPGPGVGGGRDGHHLQLHPAGGHHIPGRTPHHRRGLQVLHRAGLGPGAAQRHRAPLPRRHRGHEGKAGRRGRRGRRRGGDKRAHPAHNHRLPQAVLPGQADLPLRGRGGQALGGGAGRGVVDERGHQRLRPLPHGALGARLRHRPTAVRRPSHAGGPGVPGLAPAGPARGQRAGHVRGGGLGRGVRRPQVPGLGARPPGPGRAAPRVRPAYQLLRGDGRDAPALRRPQGPPRLRHGPGPGAAN